MEQVVIQVTRENEDFVEECMWSLGALSVSLPAQHVTKRELTALFQVAPEDLHERLCDFLGDLTIPAEAIRKQIIDEQDWLTRWRESFQTMQVGRFTVACEWEDLADTADVIRVYPGLAFGTGQHETTRMAMEMLQHQDMQQKRVLDAGCGTGILAITAERLGAASVFGFDVDPDCAENMARHLEMNKTEKVRLEIGTFDDFEHGRYDVVLANITLNVLAELWPKLPAVMAPDGLLITTGILDEQQEQAVVLLAESGFEVTDTIQRGEWVCISARLK